VEEKWDRVVAGAGPEGCSLAAKVASVGLRVLILEAMEEPGPRTRNGSHCCNGSAI